MKTFKISNRILLLSVIFILLINSASAQITYADMKKLINMEVTKMDEVLEAKGFYFDKRTVDKKVIEGDYTSTYWSYNNNTITLTLKTVPELIGGYKFTFLYWNALDLKLFQKIRNEIQLLNLPSEPFEDDGAIGTRYNNGIYEVLLTKETLENGLIMYLVQLQKKIQKE